MREMTSTMDDVAGSGEVRTCVACGDDFAISAGERAFFEGKQLSIPRRCKSCRAIRRQADSWR